MLRLLPYIVTCLVSIALTVTLILWMDERSSGDPHEVAFAPDMRFAARTGTIATVFIVTQMQHQAEQDSMIDDTKTGSGVLVSPDGYIVTNYHVVSNAGSVTVTMYDRRVFTAELVGIDPEYDLALIKVPGHNLPYLEFGNSKTLTPGEGVIAIGNPYKLNHTVTFGIVSALNRNLRSPVNETPNFIQTDVPINTGNSGGPLLNARGEFVGMMAILISVSGSYEGYSFAIPSELIQKVANDLRDYGRRRDASIKMRIRPVTPEIASYAKMQEVTGVIVDSVDEGGPADIAGLRSLDIILTVNGWAVESTSAFLGRLAAASPGDTFALTVNRDSEEINISVVLEEVE